MSDQIVEWAKELQSLAQAGLFYGGYSKAN